MRGSRGHGLLLVLLAAIGLSAAGTAWYCITRAWMLGSTHELASLKVDALVDRAARLDTALQSFQNRGEGDISWFTGASTLLGELDARAAELDAMLPGVAMASRARLAEVLQRERETLDGARANFDAGRGLMSLDLVESNGKPASEEMWSELLALRGTMAAETAAAQRQWWQRAGAAVGAWALSWAAGLVWLARRRMPSNAAIDQTAQPAFETSILAPPTIAPAPTRAPAPSLEDVADLCERIGRLRDASEVPALLAQSSAVLHASGLVLWVREADALVVGAAHGYPDGLAQRLGRVALADENLITRAWHDGRCQTSPSGIGRRAAFATPVLGPAGPVGVLAAELTSDDDWDALAGRARLVAAQFAAVLGDAAAGTRESAGDAAAATPNALVG